MRLITSVKMQGGENLGNCLFFFKLVSLSVFNNHQYISHHPFSSLRVICSFYQVVITPSPIPAKTHALTHENFSCHHHHNMSTMIESSVANAVTPATAEQNASHVGYAENEAFIAQPPVASMQKWTIVALVASMTSQQMHTHDRFSAENGWDDIGSALANIWGTDRVLYLQSGDRENPTDVLKPYMDREKCNMYAGYKWKITRKTDSAKTWQVYSQGNASEVVASLRGEKAAWQWIKNAIDNEKCFRVSNAPVFASPNASPTVTAYACAFMEACVQRMAPIGMFPNMIRDLRTPML